VRRGIAVDLASVVCLCDHLSIADHHSADGYVVVFFGATGFIESTLHPDPVGERSHEASVADIGAKRTTAAGAPPLS